MKKIFNYIILVMLLTQTLLTSCLKDTGNYDYTELTPIVIEKSTLPTTLIKKQLEYIIINPVVKQGSDDSNLKYEWRLIQAAYNADPVTGTYYNVKVSDTKNINYKITANPGNYILILHATDSKNGVTELAKIDVVVESYASKGWMILHGDNTSCDVSIVVNPRINAGWTTDYVQHNVFSETNGKKIEGEGMHLQYVGSHWVNVFTKGSKGGYRSNGNDLRIMNSFSDMFMSPLAESEVEFNAYDMWSYNELLLNKGALYFTSQADVNVYNKFGVKCFGEDYYAAPFVATIYNWAYYGVFYDQKNRRFLYIDYNRTIKQFKTPGASAAFNMTNVGKDMVYAEHGFDSRWYCLMQDGVNNNTRELYVCKFNVSDDGNRGVAKYDIRNNTDLNNAKFFAFGNRGNVMYYATDTKIYQSNYAGDLSSVLRYDILSAFPGYVITKMKIFKVSGNANESKLLYVAIYNPSDKQGKLLEIDINEVTGEMSTAGMRTYTGFSKISAMNYKTR